MEKKFECMDPYESKDGIDFRKIEVIEKYVSIDELNDILSNYIVEKEVLEFIFKKNIYSESDYINMVQRFIPTEEYEDIETYIASELKNVNFYSFLAEVLHVVIVKDLLGYELSCAVVSVDETLIDTKSGVDACMYDGVNGVFSLCESKFYKNSTDAFNKIKKDFTCDNGFKNKLQSYYKKSFSSTDFKIIIKELYNNKYTDIKIKDFLKYKLHFSGFVLHNDNNTLYDNRYYDSKSYNIENIKKNINKWFNIDEKEVNLQVLLMHLPINNKEDLIKSVIEKCLLKRNEIVDGK